MGEEGGGYVSKGRGLRVVKVWLLPNTNISMFIVGLMSGWETEIYCSHLYEDIEEKIHRGQPEVKLEVNQSLQGLTRG